MLKWYRVLFNQCLKTVSQIGGIRLRSRSHCCSIYDESAAILVNANNYKCSNVNGANTIVGCAMRTITYILTRVMVRMAHPTIVIEHF